MQEAFKRSNGFCECARVPMLDRPLGCGCALIYGRVFYEHIVPAALGGDNSLDNIAALTKACWRQKTDTYDLPTIAKSNRQRDAARGIRISRHPMPFGRKSKFKKKISGEVITR